MTLLARGSLPTEAEKNCWEKVPVAHPHEELFSFDLGG